jgi:hypothetical protein
MIEKIYPDKFTAICDICYENLDEYLSYDDALKALKDEGWICRKMDGHWHHICSSCQNDEEGLW